MALLLIVVTLLASVASRGMPANYVPSEEQLLAIFGDVSSNTSTTPVELIFKNSSYTQKKGNNAINASTTPKAVGISSRINTNASANKDCVMGNKNNSTGGSGAKNETKTCAEEGTVDDRVSIQGNECPAPKVRFGNSCTDPD